MIPIALRRSLLFLLLVLSIGSVLFASATGSVSLGWSEWLTALQDSIAQLTRAAALAYGAGYQSAYDSYGALSQRYIAQLERPRFSLGSALTFILGAGTGLVVGELIHH